MAVYKVIQDIESEDKLLGPLTLKSFVYAAIAAVLAFINVRLLMASGPIYIRLIIIFILLFPMALFGVLASPLGRDQPTEVWLLSHIRFFLKPRQRTWSQVGISQTITVTAPKKITKQLTKTFSQTEVQSRLQALATTLDSRGWAVKDSSVSLGGQPSYLDSNEGGDSDRLIGASSLPQSAAVIDVHAADDILDEQNNATAQKVNQMVKKADDSRKKAVAEKIEAGRREAASAPAAQDTRFLDAAQQDKQNTVFVGKAVVAPGSTDETQVPEDKQFEANAKTLLDQWHKRDEEIRRRSASFHTKAELAAEKHRAARKAAEKPAQNTVTPAQTAAKLELAQSGNDLSVASIAQLANRTEQVKQIAPGEIEISLH